MTQIRMRIRVCKRNMKQTGHGKGSKAMLAAIFKKKNVIWFKTISFEIFIWRENMILLQANSNRRRSDCAVKTAHLTVEL